MEITSAKKKGRGRKTDLSKTLHVSGPDKEKFLDLTGKTGHVTPIEGA